MVLGQGEQSIPKFPSLARSLVDVLVLPSPPVSLTFHPIMSHSVALPFALCVPVLPFPLVNPPARSECFVSVLASAQKDWKMVMVIGSCLHHRCWLLELHGHFCNRSNSWSDRSRTLAFFRVSQCSSRSDPTCFRVRSRSGTAAASRCCSNLHDVDRQTHTPMSRWTLVLVRPQSLTSNSLPRHSKELLELSPTH